VCVIYSLTKVELLDIVGYEYYLEKYYKKYNKQSELKFKDYLMYKSKDNVYISFENYKLGDLPKDIFL
jgi:hypothetical protein